MVVAIIALIAALSGSAIAAKHKLALPKNSVGTKQIKNKAVTTGKIGNRAITGAKVANETLTNEDIKVKQLETVPSAIHADSAANSDKISGHAANCPSGTTLVRGTCYDLALRAPVNGVKAAATQCANEGGYLPTPMELYSIRTVVNLGDGVPPHYAVADQYYADNFAYKTIVVDGSGKMEELEIDNQTQFVCAYSLVR